MKTVVLFGLAALIPCLVLLYQLVLSPTSSPSAHGGEKRTSSSAADSDAHGSASAPTRKPRSGIETAILGSHPLDTALLAYHVRHLDGLNKAKLSLWGAPQTNEPTAPIIYKDSFLYNVSRAINVPMTLLTKADRSNEALFSRIETLYSQFEAESKRSPPSEGADTKVASLDWSTWLQDHIGDLMATATGAAAEAMRAGPPTMYQKAYFDGTTLQNKVARQPTLLAALQDLYYHGLSKYLARNFYLATLNDFDAWVRHLVQSEAPMEPAQCGSNEIVRSWMSLSLGDLMRRFTHLITVPWLNSIAAPEMRAQKGIALDAMPALDGILSARLDDILMDKMAFYHVDATALQETLLEKAGTEPAHASPIVKRVRCVREEEDETDDDHELCQSFELQGEDGSTIREVDYVIFSDEQAASDYLLLNFPDSASFPRRTEYRDQYVTLVQGHPDARYFGEASIAQVPPTIYFTEEDASEVHLMTLLASASEEYTSERAPWWRLTSSKPLTNLKNIFTVIFDQHESTIPRGYGVVPHILGQGVTTPKEKGKQHAKPSSKKPLKKPSSDVREHLRITPGAYHLHALDQWSTSPLLRAPFTHIISRMLQQDQYHRQAS